MDIFSAANSGEYLYSIAAIFSLAAYVLSNMFWLRVFLVIAAILYIITGLTLGLTSMTGWNTAYLIINFSYVVLILYNRSKVLLPDELKGIYEDAFTALSTREFKNIMKTNPYRVYHSGEKIMSEGEVASELLLLLKGTASVTTRKTEVASVSTGDFIGEMGFIGKQVASADVIAADDVLVAYWTHVDLKKLEKRNTDRYNRFLSIIGRDLVRKLQRKNVQAAK